MAGYVSAQSAENSAKRASAAPTVGAVQISRMALVMGPQCFLDA